MSKTSVPPQSSNAASICGFDVGSENCYIAVARAGGIEILLNEYSQRSTPAYIGFGDKQRELGVSAKQKQMMNMSNTCYAPNRIIGRQYKDLNEDLPFKTEPSSTGEIAVKLWHNGEELTLTATQLMAMLFTKLKQISSNSIDCVINCPIYFTDSQRRSLMDAALIAGLNPIRIIPDMTAIGLYYGFYRTAPSVDVTIAAFVDSGYTSTQCSVILFNNKEHQIKVLSMEYEVNLGGKHFDEILANYFIQQQKLQLGKRAKIRLIAECEKLKRNMSANSNELPISIECLQDEMDFSGRMDRVLFEQLSEGLFKRYEQLFQRSLQSAIDKFTNEKLGEFKIDCVEIVGGTSRIPAIKRLVRAVFGVESTTTLNADEAVARGCALQCAMLSPTFKVARQFQVFDYAPYQIDFRYWHLSSSGNESDFKSISKLFPRGHQLPFTKQIAIVFNSLPIIVAFDYINDSDQTVPIGEFKIKSLENMRFTKNQMKIRVRLDPNGLITVFAATVYTEPPQLSHNDANSDAPMQEDVQINDTKDKMQNENNKNDTPMDTEDSSQQIVEDANGKGKTNDGGDAEQKTKKPKPVSVDLIVEPLWIRGKLSDTEIHNFREFELNLIAADKNWKEKIDAKNAIEEYLYEWRDKIEGGGYDPFVAGDEKQKFIGELSLIEQWLYEQEDNGEIHSKSVYEEKLAKLKQNFSDGILYRENEFNTRPALLEQLGQRLQQAKKIIEMGDMSVETDALKKLDADILETQKWLDNASGVLNNAVTYTKPPITTEQIKQRYNDIDGQIKPILYERQRRIEEKKRQDEAAKSPPPPPPQTEQESNKQNDSKDASATMDVDSDVHPTI